MGNNILEVDFMSCHEGQDAHGCSRNLMGLHKYCGCLDHGYEESNTGKGQAVTVTSCYEDMVWSH